ncbi:hypothetical protein [Massilia oculi]|uniref:hypothetical protein n=1 Tax=Massilia oculi TaxID=945844 RepID=UPI001AAFFAD3|nr:hypothetical protein [Massilia oculi]
MSTHTWIAALVLGALPLCAFAEPLGVNTHTSGRITSIENSFHELGGALQPGMPIHIDFDHETNTSFSTLESGTWATMPASGFFQFGVTVGAAYLGLRSPDTSGDPNLFNQFRLRDDVRNAAGDLVDVFELTARAHAQYDSVTYTFSANLEFAPSTFDDLDNWSILALKDALPLAGTMHLNRVAEGWDGTLVVSDLFADLSGFDARFEGPGAVVPVAEPAQYALLLAGLMAMAGSGAARQKKSGPKPAFR